MTGAMKMLMMNNQSKDNGGRSGGARGYGNAYDAQMGMGEGRQSRDSRGRFRSEGDMRMGGDNDAMTDYYMPSPYIPPIYDEGRNTPKMNKIGFASSSEMDREYHTSADYPETDEMGYHHSQTMMGHGKASGDMKLTKELAEEWMASIQNEDGTRGPHWKMEQVKQVMAQKGIGMDPVQFWVILNAIYSDYYKVLKKHGVGDKLDVYIDLACAWLNDKDAVKDKAAAYYEYVVKH